MDKNTSDTHDPQIWNLKRISELTIQTYRGFRKKIALCIVQNIKRIQPQSWDVLKLCVHQRLFPSKSRSRFKLKLHRTTYSPFWRSSCRKKRGYPLPREIITVNRFRCIENGCYQAFHSFLNPLIRSKPPLSVSYAVQAYQPHLQRLRALLIEYSPIFFTALFFKWT